MRITSGTYGRRVIEVPQGIRPTQDKVRQAIFSSLGEHTVDARVLDLFAGSGAMGLEALSRGAKSVVWVEADKKVAAVLRANVASLCGDRTDRSDKTYQTDVFSFLKTCEGPFDLVLADPPYDRGAGKGLLEKTLMALEARPILAPAAILVFEQGADEQPVERPGWELLRDRMYGGSRILIYRKAT